MTIEDTILNSNLEQNQEVQVPAEINEPAVVEDSTAVVENNEQDSSVHVSDSVPEIQSAPPEIAPKLEAYSTSSDDYRKAVAGADANVSEPVSDTNSTEFDELFEQLKVVKENNETIEVTVHERIRGGLRVLYKNMPLFLPASHFSLKRSPAEDQLANSLGQTFSVYIHELQEDETKRKTVIVSRKQQLENDFWATIKVGDVVEGNVTSIASFGVFIDLGGMEGLIHISRLSQSHIDDPKTVAKKGQPLKAVVVSINKENKRIGLSRKELEDSPWKNIGEQFPAGTVVKGIVRRFTDFGAYLEIAPGIDGLLRTVELSWTKRIKAPTDFLQLGQEIEVEVLNTNAEKQTVSLSHKKCLPNPWIELKDKYPVGTEITGTVVQNVQQGSVINIGGEVDGFMPKSKMRSILKGNKIPYNTGDTVLVIISDLVAEQESLILSPKVEGNEFNESEQFDQQAPRERQQRDNREPRGDRNDRGRGDRGRDNRDNRDNRDRRPNNQKQVADNTSNEGFSFADLLSDKQKKSLLSNS